MKKLLISVLCLVSFADAFAQLSPTFSVLVRKEDSAGTRYEKVELEELESVDGFDGKYFKIVKGKSNEAIAFNDPDQELVKKAATVYHHLSKARSFWLEKLQSKRVEELPKLVVRLEITNLFDEQGHFAHDNRSPQFNNALSIPEGETPEWVPETRKDKWEKEIWFRPMKYVDTKELLAAMGPNPLTLALQELESPFINYARNQLSQSLMEQIFYPNYATGSLGRSFMIFAGTIAMTKVIIGASKKMDRLFVDKWFYLDSAMVPEIVYHEYAHVMLSDHLQMSHSTPVNEGLADYFAAVMSNQRRVYNKVPGRSNSKPKDPHNDSTYGHWHEANQNATADFVLAVLWDVRETLGEEVGDKVVYKARTFLKTETATISDHLIRSLLYACDEVCESPRRDKLKLYKLFGKRGF